MRKAILSLTLIWLAMFGWAQNRQLDSLKASINIAPEDSVKVRALTSLADKLISIDPDSTIKYSSKARDLAEQLNYKVGLGYALKSLGMAYYYKADFTNVLRYWLQSLKTFESIDFKLGIANMSSNLGSVHFSQGDDNKAIEYYLQSLKVSEEINDKLRIATALANIGAVYSNKKQTHDLALKYYKQALPLSQELNDNEAIGTVAVNMGEIFLDRQSYDSALYYFNTSLEAYRKAGSLKEAYTLNEMGRAYGDLGNFQQAVNYQQQAYERAKMLDAKLEMTQSLLGLAQTYVKMGNYKQAISTFREAQKIGEEIQTKYELESIYAGLAQSYDSIRDYAQAFHYQKLFSIIKDSLYDEAMDKKIQILTLNFDLDKKQSDINLLTKDVALQDANLKKQRIAIYAAGSTGFLLFLLAIGLFNRYKYVRKTKRIIEYEKDRSDKLLLNILPEETAQELKEKGSANPKHYDKVSVLFTDFKGFTNIAEKLTPQELIEELNYCFFEFDKIIDEHNLEKIKTIGDAYMCAGGIPVPNETNPVEIVRAGLAIKEFMNRLKVRRESEGKDYWELRIGIHTGEVVAGVVGKNKFAYDIWGDAVNTASRMESSGIPGQVNISGTTYELIRDHFECTYRGKVKAKNKGEIDMYIVERELS